MKIVSHDWLILVIMSGYILCMPFMREVIIPLVPDTQLSLVPDTQLSLVPDTQLLYTTTLINKF